MERATHIAHIWNWLPAFRAVAEVEHLQQAAAQLHVAPSAVSRTIRLLEDALGRPLFERSSRRLVLNAAGHELLSVVRDAMRLVDDGVGGVRRPSALHVSARDDIASALVLPVVQSLAQNEPELTLFMHDPCAEDPSLLIRRGELDIALVKRAGRVSGVEVHALASASQGIYTRPGHPLAHGNRVDERALAHHAFVVTADAQGPLDDWPPERPRSTRMYANNAAVALEAVGTSDLLVVLLDYVAAVRATGLVRLDYDALPPSPLQALIRPSLRNTSRERQLVDALQARLAQLGEAHSMPSL